MDIQNGMFKKMNLCLDGDKNNGHLSKVPLPPYVITTDRLPVIHPFLGGGRTKGWIFPHY